MSSTIAKVSSHLHTHAAAYVLALCMGILMVAPYAYFAHGPAYRGIAMMGHDAEEHYLARMQEVYDGHPLLGNTFLPFKNIPYLSPGLGEDLVAYAGMGVGLSATQINLVAKVVLPLIIFLFIYGLALELSGARLAALFAALTGMLATVVMSGDSILGVIWGRPINPELSGVFLFGGLWLLYRMRANATWPAVLLLGVITGASLYLSPYVWSFLGACMGLWFLYQFWLKHYSQSLRFFLAGVVALLLDIPFVLNSIASHSYPGYAAAAAAQEILHSHAPVVGVWVVVLLVVSWFSKSLLGSEARTFFVLCSVSLAIVLNQQVLTGVYVQPGHFHWYITKPFVGIVLALVLWKLLERFAPKIQLPVAAVVSIMLVATAVVAQVNFYNRFDSVATAAQAYAPLVDYLRSQPKQVVYANPDISQYLPIYTSADTPNNAYAKLYVAPPGYLDAVAALPQQLNAAAVQKLGITLVIKDQSDSWDVSHLKLVQTVDRFKIYVP